MNGSIVATPLFWVDVPSSTERMNWRLDRSGWFFRGAWSGMDVARGAWSAVDVAGNAWSGVDRARGAWSGVDVAGDTCRALRPEQETCHT